MPGTHRLAIALRRQGLALVGLLLVAGCSPLAVIRDGPPSRPPRDLAAVPDAVPRAEPPSRRGNPPSYVANGKRYFVRATSAGYRERGIASWYGAKFHGRRTSSGERYDMYAMTAAHKTLPIPTYVEVTNLRNGRRVVVRVNDRGPFLEGRIIDLSYAAAARLGMLESGTAPVEVRALPPYQRRPGIRLDAQRYYLQVGAFASRTNAERLRRRVQAVLGGAVRIEVAGGLFRVRLGPLSDLLRAQRLLERLTAAGLPGAVLIGAR